MAAGISTSHIVRSSAEPRAPATPLERREWRLQRFCLPWRRGIAGLTACAPALEDLAETFPALLFALVSGYAEPAQTERACRLLNDGGCLKDAAEIMGLPLWMRRLPPEALAAPLPRLPTDPDYSLRIANHLPREVGGMRQWLADLGVALAAGGPGYALWSARAVKPGLLSEDSVLMLGAWAWFGQHPGCLGHTLLRRPWSPEMSSRRALDEFSAWRRRLRLIDALGLGLGDCWLEPGSAGGLDFVSLRTVQDFLDESREMENCLDQFADHLLTGNSFVFSVRRGSRRVACVEIGPHATDLALPTIVQLRGRKNRRVAPKIWQATFAWLGQQRLVPRKPRSMRWIGTQRSLARTELWQPYLAHIAGTPYEERLRRWLVLPVRARPARRGGISKIELQAQVPPLAIARTKSPESAGKG